MEEHFPVTARQTAKCNKMLSNVNHLELILKDKPYVRAQVRIVHEQLERLILMSRKRRAPRGRTSIDAFRRLADRCERIVLEARAIEVDMERLGVGFSCGFESCRRTSKDIGRTVS
jgi:hypothetical protein